MVPNWAIIRSLNSPVKRALAHKRVEIGLVRIRRDGQLIGRILVVKKKSIRSKIPKVEEPVVHYLVKIVDLWRKIDFKSV